MCLVVLVDISVSLRSEILIMSIDQDKALSMVSFDLAEIPFSCHSA